MAERRGSAARTRGAATGPKQPARPAAGRANSGGAAKGGARGDLLSIGELAKQANVSTRTIRYYEELGILPPPERTAGGTRRYPRDYIFYVEGARILKQLGFGLEEIAELGQFALTGTSASARTKAILQERLSELEHRIRVLNRLYELVNEAAAAPKSKGSPVHGLLRWVSEGEEMERTGS
ncbi:MerR family DNA-binding transcriptional regulator [Streptomyces armeniacus]|uniref:MerR family DNA-binding transcriptional regulator n=1 Tax=Streptomyces armeniacus TaxID=83291 RepID=A0A345XLD7_9ACTN|nr:MerR family DNA-binding transcriptional regulator [Streptomyces armeniacus]AXK32453.1 MerR family DNA-binding transcriptional regulator [Streptomyces armeniacus]